MRLVPLGDSAFLAELGEKPDERTFAAVCRLTAGLRAAPLRGVEAIVPSFTTVAVHFSLPEIAAPSDPAGAVAAWIGRVWTKGGGGRMGRPREWTLPVVYGGEAGPDLADVAQQTGLAEREFIRLHQKAEYQVRAIGFSPGFPYLAGLPAALHVPRRATPRTRVPAGSVAIGGPQAGVYPSATPGGWNLVGATDLRLFDPTKPEPALLRVGDRVRFKAVPEAKLAPVATPSRPRFVQTDTPTFTVLRAGVLTTVQDLGRPGFQDVGVSPGGAVDPDALAVGNLLVGNPEAAAALECSLQGPRLAVRRDATVAITGARVAGLPWARPFRVRAGEELSLERIESGVRSYLCVAGGVDVPVVLGSRSTLLSAGFGGFDGRALQPGDRIGVGPVPKGVAPVSVPWFAGPSLAPEPTGGEGEIRFVRGPQADWFAPAAWAAWTETAYRVTPRSDRMGARLEGAALPLVRPREMVSEAVATGSVQVPPDGQPIVLLADRQTIGGYPKIAQVVRRDLALIAQARPGTVLRWVEVSLGEARRLALEAARDRMWFRAGVKALLNAKPA